MMIAPDTVHGEQEQDFSQGCSHRAADLLILAGTLYRWDIAPVGGGLTGRGVAETAPPAPVSCVSIKHSFAVGGRNIPTSLLLPGHHLPG